MLFLDILSVYFVVIIPILALVIVFVIFKSIIEKFIGYDQEYSQVNDREIQLHFGVLPNSTKINIPRMKSTRKGGRSFFPNIKDENL